MKRYERSTTKAQRLVIALIEPLYAQLAALTARVKELEDRLATNSRNSSQPPSSDRLTKQTRSWRQPSGRKTGGQPGHPGTTLHQVAIPDERRVHVPAQCLACGTSLADVVGQLAPERRHIFDLPPLKLEVTEHRVLLKACAACGHRNRGIFPAGVACGARYGTGVKSVLTYLNQGHLLPSARSCEMVADLFGQPSLGRAAGGGRQWVHGGPGGDRNGHPAGPGPCGGGQLQ